MALKKAVTEEVKCNNDKTIKISKINGLKIKMLDKNTKLVYTLDDRKSRRLQTAAASPCLQKNLKIKN